jgi:hypothetical protein
VLEESTAVLEIQDPFNPVSAGDVARYTTLITLVTREEPAETPTVTISTIPAIRSCGCGDVTLPLTVARPEGAAADRPWTVRLRFTFVGADGKTPASGRVVAATAGSVLAALNQIEVEIKPGEAGATTTVTLSQLEDNSSLTITSGEVVGDKGTSQLQVKGPPGKATVLIRVGPPCGPESGKERPK